MPSCRACGGASVFPRYGVLCNPHRIAHRTHGHELQTSVTPKEIKTYLQQLSRRRPARPNAALWEHLESAWRNLLDICRYDLGLSGKHRRVIWNQQANRAVLTIGEELPPAKVIDTVIAL